MALRRTEEPWQLVIPADQSLIAIPDEIDGKEVTRYFLASEDADAFFGPEGIDRALSAIGSWSELNWEETIEALDRIRHGSPPTPPVEEP